MSINLTRVSGLTTDRKGRHVAVGRVEVSNHRGVPFDVAIELAPGPRSVGAEVEQLTITRSDGGPPVTPGAVHGLHLRSLLDDIGEALAAADPVRVWGPGAVLAVLIVDERGTVIRGDEVGSPVGLLVPERPRKPRLTADLLRQAAGHWIDSPDTSSGSARDRYTAERMGYEPASVRSWRYRSPGRWADAITAAQAQ